MHGVTILHSKNKPKRGHHQEIMKKQELGSTRKI
jgi:hypothetical protein